MGLWGGFIGTMAIVDGVVLFFLFRFLGDFFFVSIFSFVVSRIFKNRRV